LKKKTLDDKLGDDIFMTSIHLFGVGVLVIGWYVWSFVIPGCMGITIFKETSNDLCCYPGWEQDLDDDIVQL
jgi:hypothetical protein